MEEIDQNPTGLEEQHEHEYQPNNGIENELEYQPGNEQEYQPGNEHEYQPGNEQEYQPDNEQEYQPDNEQEYQPDGNHEYQPQNKHEYQPENELGYRPDNDQEYQPEAEHNNEQKFVHEFSHVPGEEDKHEIEDSMPENLLTDEEKNLTNETVDGGGDRWPGWPGESVFRMLVPAQKVGSIIGRKGEYIKRTCEETKARIKILDGPPGTRERAVSKKYEFEHIDLKCLFMLVMRMMFVVRDLFTSYFFTEFRRSFWGYCNCISYLVCFLILIYDIREPCSMI